MVALVMVVIAVVVVLAMVVTVVAGTPCTGKYLLTLMELVVVMADTNTGFCDSYCSGESSLHL